MVLMLRECQKNCPLLLKHLKSGKVIKLASVGRCAIFIALIAGILGTNRDGHHIVLNGVVQDAHRKFNVECDEGVLTWNQ